jgi:hypothetical protein
MIRKNLGLCHWSGDLDTNNSLKNLAGHNDMPECLAEYKLFTLDYTRIFWHFKVPKGLSKQGLRPGVYKYMDRN